MKMKAFLTMICLIVAGIASAQINLTHPWAGKRVAYLGDSVTDPRNGAAYHKYWACLEDWLAITPYVYAVSGREWTDVPRQAAKLSEEHGTAFDAILIFMGTNDYNNATPIGRWYDEEMATVEYGHRYEKRPEDRIRRTPVMDPNTLKGRINIALDSLKRTFPDKQIVLLTPIHRSGFYANEKNWQIPEDYANRCGEYLDAYSEAIREAGQVWAVPVIDLGALCGLYPLMDEHAQYFRDADKDRLHPNNAGHERMARTLMYQLLTIPCEF